MPNEERSNTGNGMPYLVPGKGVQRQRDQDDDVGKQDRQQRLANAQAKVRGQHAAQGVGRHADRHADPQCGDVPFIPGSFTHLGRCHVVVITGTVEYIAAGFELEQAVALGHLRSDLLHGRSTVLLIIFAHQGLTASINVPAAPPAHRADP
jgi:hypothetical protein